MRDELLDLHKMAAEIIDEDPDGPTEQEEPIWSMAEMLASEILEFTTGLEQAYETLKQLETLIPGDDDWDEDDPDGQKTADDEPEAL